MNDTKSTQPPESWQPNMDIFGIFPPEVVMDDRLSKIQMRVLLAILLFRNKDTNLCWPKREQIAAYCGYTVKTISTATTALVKLGWLEKTGKGGCSKASTYRFTVPELVTVPEPKTVMPQTVPEPETKRSPNQRPAYNRPVTDHKDKQTNSCSSGDERFDEWYQQYPRKKGKEPARKAWKRMGLDRKADTIIADTLKRSAVEWNEVEFIPYASTYINQQRWEDEIQPRTNELTEVQKYEQSQRRNDEIQQRMANGELFDDIIADIERREVQRGDGHHVDLHVEALPSTVDEDERRHWRGDLPRLVE